MRLNANISLDTLKKKTPNMAYFEVGYGQLYPMVKRYDYEKALRIYEQEQKETSMEGQE